MLTEGFVELLDYEGVVSVVSCANNTAHVANTWNSYILLSNDKIYIPAYGFRKTQRNVEVNPSIKLTFGSKEIMGYKSMGRGFLIEGEGKFLTEGPEAEQLRETYRWAKRVLEVTVTSLKQTV